jgi:hypothetical protein
MAGRELLSARLQVVVAKEKKIEGWAELNQYNLNETAVNHPCLL